MRRSRTALTVTLSLLGLSGTALAETNLIPNSERYADRNPSAATGRSGNATLAVRALLGKDNTTVVDVSSGRVDGTTAGNISKLLFKAYNNQGAVAWTQNITNLTGSTQQTTFTGLRRGQPLQSQANITQIDGNRSDVVVTSGNVRLRPDLQIKAVDAPASEKTGVAVQISAVVTEINGETGARANCILTVNGTEVDRAHGIWVDAQGQVSCAFTRVFDFAGTYALAVSASDVDPGDWDTANNAASASIEIVSPPPSNSVLFSWFAVARDESFTSSGKSNGKYGPDPFGNAADWDYEWSNYGRTQRAFVGGSSMTHVTFPVTLQFTGAADGLTFADHAREAVMPTGEYDDGFVRRTFYQHHDRVTGLVFVVDNIQFNGPFGGLSWSHIHAGRFAGDVTYYSRGYAQHWFGYDGSYHFYDFNRSERMVDGQFWPMTNNVSMTLSATDAIGKIWSAAPSIALQPFAHQWDMPYTCFEFLAPWGNQYSCHEHHFSVQGIQGWTWGLTQ